jgi:GxxExxY protein
MMRIRPRCGTKQAHEQGMPTMKEEQIARAVVHEAFELHREFGPGLLENVYEAFLEIRLREQGMQVERQKSVGLVYEGVEIKEAFRVDLLVERRLVLELKSLDKLAPVHFKQVLTYLKILDLPLGLLVNFGAPMFKQGVHRVVNNHRTAAARTG